MNGHAPILAVLVAGAITVHSTAQEFVLVCKRGTFSMNGDQATILVEKPMKLNEIDVAVIRDRLAAQATEAPPARMDPEEVAYLELLCRVKENHG
jgi:F0F1-type ATP synthase epsilon subunit